MTAYHKEYLFATVVAPPWLPAALHDVSSQQHPFSTPTNEPAVLAIEKERSDYLKLMSLAAMKN